jgi:hypothetical protein
MKRALRQMLFALGASAAGAAAGAAVWTLITGDSYRIALAFSFMLFGALVGLSGGSVATRAGTNDTWAFLGMGPDRPQESAGEGLTSVGFFLFVGLPLLIIGLVLYGRG